MERQKLMMDTELWAAVTNMEARGRDKGQNHGAVEKFISPQSEKSTDGENVRERQRER